MVLYIVTVPAMSLALPCLVRPAARPAASHAARRPGPPSRTEWNVREAATIPGVGPAGAPAVPYQASAVLYQYDEYLTPVDNRRIRPSGPGSMAG
ncbi:hypothetical protein GCM10010298_24960 [Streptomyces microflavus]|uniref:Uncharacterized protein n=1 Tax=Streptomyces microflavus TaxID=1919 RepID=A0A7J0CZ07_STRMI|nr:hypothetical protein Smic_55310 [Streptomyces microflavus]GGX59532.1 hypothetical protein GCM10010298_24960 [Streptomyces microflavus]